MGKQYEHLSLEDRCRIARLHEDGQSVRQIAAALDRPPSTISRELKRNRGKQIGYKPAMLMSRRRPGAGPARAWSATASCAASCSTACGTAGRPSRSPAGWPATRLRPASAMKASIASSMPRSAAPTTAPGGTIFPGPKPNAAGAAAKADRRRASSRAASPSPSAPRRPTTAPFQDIGKPTSCSSKPMARPSWSPTSACPGSSSSPDSQAKPPNPPLANSSPGSSPCHPSCARPSPSTTAPSSPSTTASSRPRYPNLLLRYPQPLAKGRHRKRHRTHATATAAQDRSPRHPPQNPQCLRRRLQQHPTKMPGLPNPSRGIPAQLLHFKCESTSPLSPG